MVQVEEQLRSFFLLKEQTFLTQVMLQQLHTCESVVAINMKKKNHFDVSFWDILDSVCPDALLSSSVNENTDIWGLFHQTEKYKPLLKTLFKYFYLLRSLNSFIFLLPITFRVFFTAEVRSRRRQMGWKCWKQSEWSSCERSEMLFISHMIFMGCKRNHQIQVRFLELWELCLFPTLDG